MRCPRCKNSTYQIDRVGWFVCLACGVTSKKSSWLQYDSNQEQPDPVPNDHPPAWELVIQDMWERNEFGKEKYGTYLQPFNGRDALIDAYQEVLDLAVYLRQKIYEEQMKERGDEQ